MSLKQFYRESIPMVRHFTGTSGGRPIEYTTPIMQPQGNVQPMKQGLFPTQEASSVRFIKYWVLFIKNMPEWDLSGAPPEVQDMPIDESSLWVYVEGRWLLADGVQDWTRAGRAVKHWKLVVKGDHSGLTVPDGIKNLVPTPIRDLVTRFTNEVNELEQVAPMIKEIL